MMTTVTCDAVFHGSHLNLMKISQTKNAVDAEEQGFHQASPAFAPVARRRDRRGGRCDRRRQVPAQHLELRRSAFPWRPSHRAPRAGARAHARAARPPAPSRRSRGSSRRAFRCRRRRGSRPASCRPTARRSATAGRRTPATAGTACGSRPAADGGACAAIFSGSTCTSQNSTIAPIGTTTMTNHARPIAAVSIISGGRNEACADGASANAAKASAAFAAVEGFGTAIREFIVNDFPWCFLMSRTQAAEDYATPASGQLPPPRKNCRERSTAGFVGDQKGAGQVTAGRRIAVTMGSESSRAPGDCTMLGLRKSRQKASEFGHLTGVLEVNQTPAENKARPNRSCRG